MYMRNVLILSFMLAVFAIFVVNAQTTVQPEPEATPTAEPEATVTSEPEMTTASGSVSYSGSLFFITGCILNTLLVKTL